MYQIQIVLIIFIVILFASAYPILSLKYNSDLYEYTDKLNNQCSKQKEEKEKDKYVWQISNYLYDYNSLDIFKDKNDGRGTGDLTKLNHMKLYNDYFKSSVGQLIWFIIFVIGYGTIVFGFRPGYLQEEWFSSSLILLMIVFVILFIIIFALILKKITEIYNDTDTFEYMIFMKKLDFIINEATKETSIVFPDKENKKMLKNLHDTSYDPDADEKRYGVQNLILTEDILYKLKEKYENVDIGETKKVNGKQELDLKNIYFINKDKGIDSIDHISDYFFKYHQKSHKENIRGKINTVASYLYAYLVLLLAFLILLFRSIDNYYIYPIVMIMLLIAVSAYYIYTSLH